jgi:hypothetical protein
MSSTLRRGLATVSAKMQRVLSDSAARKFSGSSESTKTVSMPSFLRLTSSWEKRAAVERTRGDDAIAGLAQGQQRDDLRREAGGRGDRGAATFERRHALLEGGNRGVADARIDVAEGLQVEQAGRVFRRIEDEGGGLVDRQRTRAGRRVRLGAGMQAERFDSVLAIRHGLGQVDLGR